MLATTMRSRGFLGVAAAIVPKKASSTSAILAPVASRKCVISGAAESGWMSAGSAPRRLAA